MTTASDMESGYIAFAELSEEFSNMPVLNQRPVLVELTRFYIDTIQMAWKYPYFMGIERTEEEKQEMDSHRPVCYELEDFLDSVINSDNYDSEVREFAALSRKIGKEESKNCFFQNMFGGT